MRGGECNKVVYMVSVFVPAKGSSKYCSKSYSTIVM